MNKLVNFEDSIYLILVRIGFFKDFLALDADSTLFLQEIFNDIDFIDNTLDILLSGITENPRLIDQDSLLDHLTEADWQFEKALTELLGIDKRPLISDNKTAKDKISIILSRCRERQKKAENILNDRETTSSLLSKTNKLAEPLVSSNELNELLKAL